MVLTKTPITHFQDFFKKNKLKRQTKKKLILEAERITMEAINSLDKDNRRLETENKQLEKELAEYRK